MEESAPEPAPEVSSAAPVTAAEVKPSAVAPTVVTGPVDSPRALNEQALSAATQEQPTTTPDTGRRKSAEVRGLVAKWLEQNPEATREQIVAEADRIGRTDTTTGLLNKQGWHDVLETITPDDHVVMIDLKKFKPINDRVGHEAGDQALRGVGDVLRKHFGDESARPGGDEFAAVIRGLPPEEVQAKLEAFQTDLAQHKVTVTNPHTKESIDIPGFEAHIGLGRNEAAADTAANINAAESRAGGRGDIPLPGEAALDPNRPVEAAPRPAEPGLAASTPEVAKPAVFPDGQRAMPAFGPYGPNEPKSSQPMTASKASLIGRQIRAFIDSDIPDEEIRTHAFLDKPAKELILSERAKKRLNESSLRGTSGITDFMGLETTSRIVGNLAKAGFRKAEPIVTRAYELAKSGLRDVKDFTVRLVKEFGESIRSHAQALFDWAADAAERTMERYPEAAKAIGSLLDPAVSNIVERTPPGPIKPIPAKPPQAKVLDFPTPEPAKMATVEGAPPKSTGEPQQLNLPGTPEPAKAKPTLFDKFLEGWKSGLVSAPGTQIVNPASNIGEAGVRVGESFLAGGIDKLLGGPRTRFSGEAAEQIKGAFSQLPTAAQTLADGIRGVLNSEGAIEGTKGKVARIPLQLLGVGDATTAALNGGAVSRAVAFREASRRLPNGTKGEVRALQQEILEGNNPAFVKEVNREVSERQFRGNPDSPDAWIEGLERLRRENKALHIVMPFLQTPAHIAKITIQRSPLGYGKAIKQYSAYKTAVREGRPRVEIEDLKGKAVDSLSRATLGTAVLGVFGSMAKAGLMTGSGPTDAREKSALRESGWAPYSFVVPGENGERTYIPYARFQPVASLLGFAADMAETGNARTAGDAFDKGLGSFMENMTNKTYLTGLADAVEVINKPREAAGRYVSSLAGSLVPNVVTKTAQAIDPTIRDTKPSTGGIEGIPERIANTVASRIPFLSETLPAAKSATGEDIERPGNPASRLFSPVQITSDRADRELEAYLSKLGAVPSQPSREVTVPGMGKHRLSDEEYSVFQKARQKASDRLRRATRSPGFRRLDEDAQRNAVEKVFREATAEARAKVLPRLARRVRSEARSL